MAVVAELTTALVGAGKALAATRETLQRNHAGAGRTKVMRDNLAAEMSRAEAMVTAAVDRPAVLAKDPLFAVDMEILTSRMNSVRTSLSDYESASIFQRMLCGDIPDTFLVQNCEWIQDLMEKWEAKISELMSMSPAEVDAQDFARARAIFARPLMLVLNSSEGYADASDDTNAAQTKGLCFSSPLHMALEDMQVSTVTGHLYKRGTCQKQILQDLGFSLSSHHFKTRKYNKGRDKVIAKLSALSRTLSYNPAGWNQSVDELRETLNSLLPHDQPIGDDGGDEDEDIDAPQDTYQPPPPAIRVHVVACGQQYRDSPKNQLCFSKFQGLCSATRAFEGTVVERV